MESVRESSPFSLRCLVPLTLIGWVTGVASIGVLIFSYSGMGAGSLLDSDSTPFWLIQLLNLIPLLALAVPILSVTLPLVDGVRRRPAVVVGLLVSWAAWLAVSVLGWMRLDAHFDAIGDDGWAGDGLVLVGVAFLLMLVLVSVPLFNLIAAAFRSGRKRRGAPNQRIEQTARM